MNRQPFYAVRVVLTDKGGSSFQRDYVRGETRMGKDSFNRWALGDFIYVIGGAHMDGDFLDTYKIIEIDGAAVAENSRYKHTTH